MHSTPGIYRSLMAVLAIGICLSAIRQEGFAKSDEQPAHRMVLDGKVVAQKLRHVISPVYPSEARKNGIEGTVKLRAIIAIDGSIQQLRVETGDPLLTKAAVDAVKQW